MRAVAQIDTQPAFPYAALRPEPPQFDLQKAILDATPDCIKLLSVDGTLRLMNRAGCIALNIPEDSGFGMPWLSLLPEEVHPLGREALCKAAAGQNARFSGKSKSSNGTMYWDNLLIPIVDVCGVVSLILCISRDVTEKIKHERELEDAIGRQKLLSAELQHRIGNLFSVVSGLAFIAEKEANGNKAPETGTAILRDKLEALARASDAAFSSSHGHEADGDSVALKSLVSVVLRPYAERYTAIGDEVSISRNTIKDLALFFHELATNSVKYGAFSAHSGKVTLRWTMNGERLDLTWSESGGPPVPSHPQRSGFGSKMMDYIIRSTGGSIEKVWQKSGLIIHLDLPIVIHD